MSLISFAVYLSLALIINYAFNEESIFSVFEHGFPFSMQLLAGGSAGFFAAAVIIWLSGRPPISGVLDDFYIVRIITQIRFTSFDRVQLSFFAGTGEELLFRGVIQPLLGIWITSVIFIGIHGYFKFKTAGHLIFGLMMFGLSVMLGYLFEYAGLIAAMTAHTVYDILMLWWVKRRAERAGECNNVSFQDVSA